MRTLAIRTNDSALNDSEINEIMKIGGSNHGHESEMILIYENSDEDL